MLQEEEDKAVRNKQVIIWTFCKCTNSEAFSKGNLNFSAGNFLANLPPKNERLSLVLPLWSRAAAQVQGSKPQPQDLSLSCYCFFLQYNPAAQSGKHHTQALWSIAAKTQLQQVKSISAELFHSVTSFCTVSQKGRFVFTDAALQHTLLSAELTPGISHDSIYSQFIVQN